MGDIEFLSIVRTLGFIKRCSTTPVVKSYSVAEHSYYVALYSMVISRILGFKGDRFLRVMYEKALVHDLDECIVGDVIFTTHYNNPSFEKELALTREKKLRELLCNVSSSILSCEIMDLWNSSKNGMEGEIVKFADRLELMFYCLVEKRLGNSFVGNIFYNCYDTIEKMKVFKFRKIKDLVNNLLREFSK